MAEMTDEQLGLRGPKDGVVTDADLGLTSAPPAKASYDPDWMGKMMKLPPKSVETSSKGAIASGISSGVNALNTGLSEIAAPIEFATGKAVGISPQTIQMSRQAAIDKNTLSINPQHNLTNLGGRVVGGSAPLIGSTLVGGPMTGVIAGGAQGMGSGLDEGASENLTSGQTAALTTERGLFNAILGLVPGAKGAGVFKTAATVGLTNVTQAAVEADVKRAMGIEGDDAWIAMKKAALSGNNLAQMALFGAVHAVVSERTPNKPSGEIARPTEAPAAPGTVDALQPKVYSQPVNVEAPQGVADPMVARAKMIQIKYPELTNSEALDLVQRASLRETPTEVPAGMDNSVKPVAPPAGFLQPELSRYTEHGPEQGPKLSDASLIAGERAKAPDGKIEPAVPLVERPSLPAGRDTTVKPSGQTTPFLSSDYARYVEHGPEQGPQLPREKAAVERPTVDASLEETPKVVDAQAIPGPKVEATPAPEKATKPPVDTSVKTPAPSAFELRYNPPEYVPPESKKSSAKPPEVVKSQSSEVKPEVKSFTDLAEKMVSLKEEAKSLEGKPDTGEVHARRTQLNFLLRETWSATNKLFEEQFGRRPPMDAFEFLQQLHNTAKNEVGLSGKKPAGVGGRTSGFIDFTPIIDAALKAGKWAGHHTAIAADWVGRQVEEGRTKLEDVRSALIKRFGGTIKPHVDSIFKTLSDAKDYVLGKHSDIVSKVGTWMRNVTDKVTMPWDSQINNLERSGSGPVTRAATAGARKVGDQIRVRNSQIEETLHDTLKYASRNSKEVRILNDIQPAPNGTFVSNHRVAQEPANYTAFKPIARGPALDSMEKTNLEIGKQAASVISGFKATGLLQKSMTSDAISAALKNSPSWTKFVDAVKAMNPSTPAADIDTYYRELRNDLVAGRYDVAQRSIAQEHTRGIQRTPSGVMERSLGVEKPTWFLHDKPLDYFSTVPKRVINRAAWKDVFGKTDIPALKEGLAKEGFKGPVAFDEVSAAVHGLPTSYDRGLADPNSATMTLLRGLNSATRLPYSAALATAAPHTALGAVYGSTPRVFGPVATARGAAYAASHASELFKLATVDHIVTDISLDPRSPIRDSIKVTANGLAMPNNFAHQVHGILAAATAKVVADDVRTGNVSEYGKGNFVNAARTLGFSSAEAEKLASGKASQEEYDAFVRRSATVIGGRNATPADVSKLENTGVFNLMFKAMRYPATNLRLMDKGIRMLGEDWARGDAAQAWRTSAMLGRQGLGIAVTGLGVHLLGALLTSGYGGLKIAINENKDEAKTDTLKWSMALMAKGMGGPLGSIYSMMNSDRPTDPTSLSYNFGLLKDLTQVASHTGKFAHEDYLEGWSSFGRNRFTLGRVANTWMGVLATGGDSKDLDNATAAQRRFEVSQGMEHTTMTGGSAEKDDFRRDMRKAVTAITNKEDPTELILKALDAKSPSDISEALRARRLLFDGAEPYTPDQMKALTNRIGEDSVKKLQDYDDTLTSWALAYEPVSRVGRLGFKKQAESIVPKLNTSADNMSAYKRNAQALRHVSEMKNEVRRERMSRTETAP